MSVGAVNKQTGERIPTAGMPAVDSVLSGTSTNPVQNRVVKEALDGNEKDIYAAMGEMGAKNLIPYPYYEKTHTENGVNFTDNGDCTITVDTDGSASTEVATFFCQTPTVLSNLIKLDKNKTYIFSDSTHSGIANNCVAGIRYFAEGVVPSTKSGTADSCKESNNWQVTVTNAVYAYVYVYVWSGKTISNITLKPMLRLASDTDGTYQPYAKTNKQLTDDVALLESGKADTDMVAADFNAGSSYSAGNYCVQDGKLYKFKNNHSGAWSSADVDEVKITGELSSLKSGLIGANYILNDSVKGGDNITRLRGNVTKISNVVTITGVWQGSATNTTIITLIPEGFRPSGSGAADAVLGSGTIDNGGTLSYAEYTILPNGQLRQAQVAGAVSGGTFTFCYAI